MNQSGYNTGGGQTEAPYRVFHSQEYCYVASVYSKWHGHDQNNAATVLFSFEKGQVAHENKRKGKI